MCTIKYLVHIQEFINILIFNNLIWFWFFGGVGFFICFVLLSFFKNTLSTSFSYISHWSDTLLKWITQADPLDMEQYLLMWYEIKIDHARIYQI